MAVHRASSLDQSAYSSDAKTHSVLDTKVVLIKEFRSPARTEDGFLHDLPGGSSFRAAPEEALEVAADELESETGLKFQPSRFRYVTARQMAGTFGTHKAHLFAVELTADEIARAEELEQHGASFGVAAETEKTYVEVRTIRRILSDKQLDHATVGMVVQACLTPWFDGE